jgi:hypothetical protein
MCLTIQCDGESNFLRTKQGLCLGNRDWRGGGGDGCSLPAYAKLDLQAAAGLAINEDTDKSTHPAMSPLGDAVYATTTPR